MARSRGKGTILILSVLLALSVLTSMMLLGIVAGGSSVRSVVRGGHWKVEYVLDLIRGNYVDSIAMETIEDGAIAKLLEQLDPHSRYVPASIHSRLREPIRGDFDGIGVTFNMLTDTVIVQSIIPGGPAEKVGLLLGDRLLKVDTTAIAGVSMPQDSIVSMLRGPRGTMVQVAVRRLGVEEPIDFTIVRDRIPLNSVEVAYMADDKTGVVRLSRFSQTTPQDFHAAILNLINRGMERMVLDLRDNGGGVLEAALYLSNLFLQKDDPIMYAEGKNRPRRDYRCPQPGILRNMPLVVLINEHSASASEIVAGAMQDNDRAMIVGLRSFGKGLVQELLDFPDGSGLQLTTMRYYTPSNRCIQKPYELGEVQEYDSDLYRRWTHGELLMLDSVERDTTNLHFTRGGRPVYGGGGIIPDIFVPIDTSHLTQSYVHLVRRGMHIRYTQQYVDAHRKELSAYGSATQLVEFLQGEAIFEKFKGYLRSQKVRVDERELETMQKQISTMLHAHIADKVLGRTGFFQLLQPLDNSLLKGLELLATGKSRPELPQ